MKNDFLKVLWFYPSYAPARRRKLNAYFEGIKEDALNGDAYATYAAFVIDIVCFRKDSTITIGQMDAILDSYNYPSEYSDRLRKEVSALLR